MNILHAGKNEAHPVTASRWIKLHDLYAFRDCTLIIGRRVTGTEAGTGGLFSGPLMLRRGVALGRPNDWAEGISRKMPRPPKEQRRRGHRYFGPRDKVPVV